MSLDLNYYPNYFLSNKEDYEYNCRQKFIQENEYCEYYPHQDKNTLFQEEGEENTDNQIFNFNLNEKAFISNNSADNNEYEQFYTIEVTRSTEIKTRVFRIKKSKRIFSIKKEKKPLVKRGRRCLNEHFESRPKHDKNAGDNIILKIKRQFINKTFNYINKKYENYLSEKKLKKRKLLQRIEPSIYNKYSRKTHQKLLGMHLYQLFSADVSAKNSKFLENHSKGYNKAQIELLFKKNKAKEVIEILKYTVEQMYEKYISGEIEDFNLENDLKEMEEKEEPDYINKYKAKAENLIYILKVKGMREI